mmetsp:Transcript_75385/g.243876  ORF Transcript_75385/g.243876 Transcript_75385/m.243876 type:complete len:212 (-) Transcript_75385:1995-2630(-)
MSFGARLTASGIRPSSTGRAAPDASNCGSPRSGTGDAWGAELPRAGGSPASASWGSSAPPRCSAEWLWGPGPAPCARVCAQPGAAAQPAAGHRPTGPRSAVPNHRAISGVSILGPSGAAVSRWAASSAASTTSAPLAPASERGACPRTASLANAACISNSSRSARSLLAMTDCANSSEDANAACSAASSPQRAVLARSSTSSTAAASRLAH